MPGWGVTTHVFCTMVTQPASAEQATVYHKMEEAVKVRRENAVSLAPRPSLLPMFDCLQYAKRKACSILRRHCLLKSKGGDRDLLIERMHAFFGPNNEG